MVEQSRIEAAAKATKTNWAPRPGAGIAIPGPQRPRACTYLSLCIYLSPYIYIYIYTYAYIL